MHSMKNHFYNTLNYNLYSACRIRNRLPNCCTRYTNRYNYYPQCIYRYRSGNPHCSGMYKNRSQHYMSRYMIALTMYYLCWYMYWYNIPVRRCRPRMCIQTGKTSMNFPPRCRSNSTRHYMMYIAYTSDRNMPSMHRSQKPVQISWHKINGHLNSAHYGGENVAEIWDFKNGD